MTAIDSRQLPARELRDSARATAIDDAVAVLRKGAGRLRSLSLEDRAELADYCAAGVVAAARDWVEVSCEVKRIPPESGGRAEEVLAGPVAVVRQLRLLAQTVRDIREGGVPNLLGNVELAEGQMRIPVFPTASLYDRLLFRSMTAETWLQPGLSQPFGQNIARLTKDASSAPIVVCVLGAGNVSSIPATDALTKILQENKAVLLKMSPVNEYLGQVFEQSLAPLVDAGFLRIVYGGADVGRYAVEHEGVDEVHITGSVATHDAILWGTDPQEREGRQAEGRRILEKPVTSELGNVTPWAIVPGRYSEAQLRFQAESVAASIVNNASFNCIATKVILTCQAWPQRERFLGHLERILEEVPPRFAYYPGAADRFRAFAGRDADDPRYLPWTLVRDTRPEDSPHLFGEESFVCVCAESPLDADSPEQFLYRAVYFMNDRLWGTLAAALTVPASFRKRHAAELDSALRSLRYGTIGINQWPGVAYALMSPPWGGYPASGNDLRDVQSGTGWVHNTFLLDRPEKTILASPLRFSPRPVWFPGHRSPEALAWRLLDLYDAPAVRKLPGLVLAALRG